MLGKVCVVSLSIPISLSPFLAWGHVRHQDQTHSDREKYKDWRRGKEYLLNLGVRKGDKYYSFLLQENIKHVGIRNFVRSKERIFKGKKKICGEWGQTFLFPFYLLEVEFSSFQEIYELIEVGRKEGRKAVCAFKISIESRDISKRGNGGFRFSSCLSNTV